jgi:hypothetical protein
MVDSSNVCLIVCFYKGPREGGQEQLYNEYLSTHKKMLKLLKHNLSNIIFVISEDGRETIETVIEENITYFYRPNKGLSFGGWIDVCKHYKQLFDYYIFCEDDYYFIKDDFDKILVDEYNACKKQYMVTWRDKIAQHCEKYYCELISTIGILSSKVLQEIDYFKNFSYTNIKARGNGWTMYDFLISFDSIGSISEKYERFIYYTGADGNTIVIFDNNVKDTEELNKERVLLCCYQALSDYFQST